MKKLPDLTLQNLVKGMLFLCLLLLPFINILHVSTFLLIALAVVCLLNRNTYQLKFLPLFKQPLFWIFLGLYILQLVQFISLPVADNRFALEQKASLILMPVLFFVLINSYTKLWELGKTAFVIGNLLACVICLVLASNRFMQSGNEYEFFYHKLSNGIGQGAIYFTLYLLVSLFYTVSSALKNWQSGNSRRFYFSCALAAFFYINILLLSSKMLIVAGSVLVSLFVIRYTEISFKRKFAFFAVLVFLATFIFSTNNPVSKRYKAVNFDIYSSAFTQNDFKDFPFDGFNFRLFLFRMGCEILSENSSYLIGNGGKHYHSILNQKIIKYDLYTGNGKNDSGYLNYNLHDQYMESFVQNGISGFLFILFLIICAYYHAQKTQKHVFKLITILFAIVFITESVLETQAGILLVTIIISGEWIALHQNILYSKTE